MYSTSFRVTIRYMAKTNDLTQQILAFLFEKRVYAWRQNTTGVFDKTHGVYRLAAKKGVADILACRNGQFLAFEIKIGRDKLSSEQAGFIKSINAAGGFACVISSFDQFLGVYAQLDKG